MAFFQEWFTFCRDAYSSVPVDGSAGLHRVPAQRMRWININDPKCLSVLRTVFTHNDGLKRGGLQTVLHLFLLEILPCSILFALSNVPVLPLLIFLCFQPTSAVLECQRSISLHANVFECNVFTLVLLSERSPVFWCKCTSFVVSLLPVT